MFKLINCYFNKFMVLEFSVILGLYVFYRFSTDEIILQRTNKNRIFGMFFCYYTMTYKNVQILRFDSTDFIPSFLLIVHAYSIWWKKRKKKSKEINVWKRIEYLFDDRKCKQLCKFLILLFESFRLFGNDIK